MNPIETESEPVVAKVKTPQTTFVRLRGLPFFSAESDIRTFFNDINVDSVIFTKTGGRPSGEAYVEVASKDDVTKALSHQKQEIGGRYIEIFTVSVGELLNLQNRNVITDEGKIVRLRGIPFNASVDDIKEFLKGADCVEVIMGRKDGKSTGEAFVTCATKAHTLCALQKNKEYMGKRYVEIFRGTVEEMDACKWQSDYLTKPPLVPLMNRQNGPLAFHGDISTRKRIPQSRPAPYDLPSKSYGYDVPADYTSPTKIYMRGVPYHCDPSEIELFFTPLQCIEIKIGYNEDGRPSGDAAVEFGTISEAQEAMSRNKGNIGKRYVELFRSDDVPPPIKRLIFKTVQGSSTGPPLPLTGNGYANRGGTFRGYADDLRMQPASPPTRHYNSSLLGSYSMKPIPSPMSNVWGFPPEATKQRRSWLY